jgi:hypothetical protein
MRRAFSMRVTAATFAAIRRASFLLSNLAPLIAWPGQDFQSALHRAPDVDIERYEELLQSCQEPAVSQSGATRGESLIKAGNQLRITEGLFQEADRAGGKRPSSCLHFREGGYKNHRQMPALLDQMTLELYSCHSWHLNVSNQAIDVVATV